MSWMLLVQILYWGFLLSWSAVITYIVLFVFFPEKLRHAEHAISDALAPTFARHRFQQLPGSDALTVNDIVTALSHAKLEPIVEMTEDAGPAAEPTKSH